MSDLIHGYLEELRQALRVSPPAQERILYEVEDHLCEGAEHEREHGVSREEAQRRTIERFGSPRDVAAMFTAEFAAMGDQLMWQRFTERARRVVFYAQEEAARMNENYVGTEHLLLGLTREYTLVGCALECMGVSLATVRRTTEQRMTTGSGRTDLNMQLTPPAKRVIDLAYEEARELNDNYIGTDHLLPALIREEEGLAGRVLADLGVDLEKARAKIKAVKPKWPAIDEARTRLEKAEEEYRALLASV